MLLSVLHEIKDKLIMDEEPEQPNKPDWQKAIEQAAKYAQENWQIATASVVGLAATAGAVGYIATQKPNIQLPPLLQTANLINPPASPSPSSPPTTDDKTKEGDVKKGDKKESMGSGTRLKATVDNKTTELSAEGKKNQAQETMTVDQFINKMSQATGASTTFLRNLCEKESGCDFWRPNGDGSGYGGIFQTPDGHNHSAQKQLEDSIALYNEKKSALGGNPSEGMMALAWNQGASGAEALVSRPNELAIDVLSDFHGKDTAKLVITQNGGNLSMTAGDFARNRTAYYGVSIEIADIPAPAKIPQPNLTITAPPKPSSPPKTLINPSMPVPPAPIKPTIIAPIPVPATPPAESKPFVVPSPAPSPVIETTPTPFASPSAIPSVSPESPTPLPTPLPTSLPTSGVMTAKEGIKR
jgi:hypothetical protein